MSLEIIGKLISRKNPQIGQGKNGQWEKVEFAIETQGQYPKKVAFDIWNDKIKMLSGLKGATIKVSFEPSSREYNEKWYTNLQAWKVSKVNTQQQQAPTQPTQQQEQDFNNESDDLPF